LKGNPKDAELERYKPLASQKRSMIYVFIKNNDIDCDARSKELLSMKSQSVSDRKQRVVLVKEKKLPFILSQNNVTVALE
jgi:hypothetical protein